MGALNELHRVRIGRTRRCGYGRADPLVPKTRPAPTGGHPLFGDRSRGVACVAHPSPWRLNPKTEPPLGRWRGTAGVGSDRRPRGGTKEKRQVGRRVRPAIGTSGASRVRDCGQGYCSLHSKPRSRSSRERRSGRRLRSRSVPPQRSGSSSKPSDAPLVGLGARACRSHHSLGIPANVNVVFGVHELAAYDPMLPRSYYEAWLSTTGRQGGYPGTSRYCPAVTSAALARLYGASFILELHGAPGPRGRDLRQGNRG